MTSKPTSKIKIANFLWLASIFTLFAIIVFNFWKATKLFQRWDLLERKQKIAGVGWIIFFCIGVVFGFYLLYSLKKDINKEKYNKDG